MTCPHWSWLIVILSATLTITAASILAGTPNGSSAIGALAVWLALSFTCFVASLILCTIRRAKQQRRRVKRRYRHGRRRPRRRLTKDPSVSARRRRQRRREVVSDWDNFARATRGHVTVPGDEDAAHHDGHRADEVDVEAGYARADHGVGEDPDSSSSNADRSSDRSQNEPRSSSPSSNSRTSRSHTPPAPPTPPEAAHLPPAASSIYPPTPRASGLLAPLPSPFASPDPPKRRAALPALAPQLLPAAAFLPRAAPSRLTASNVRRAACAADGEWERGVASPPFSAGFGGTAVVNMYLELSSGGEVEDGEGSGDGSIPIALDASLCVWGRGGRDDSVLGAEEDTDWEEAGGEAAWRSSIAVPELER